MAGMSCVQPQRRMAWLSKDIGSRIPLSSTDMIRQSDPQGPYSPLYSPASAMRPGLALQTGGVNFVPKKWDMHYVPIPCKPIGRCK